MEKAPIIAAIDIGTNSIHLVIASINQREVLTIIDQEKEMVRLGQSGNDMKYLQEDAIDRGVETLKRFAKLAENHSAIIRAVATSAVREALNKDIFINRAKEETGINIEVVSGVEESRLIFLGVSHALPITDKDALVVDIGGGSTETVIGRNYKIKFAHSDKIGAIRLTKQFLDSQNYTKSKIEEIRKYVIGEWTPTLNNIKSTGFDLSIGTSGTIQSLAAMSLIENGEAPPDFLNGYSVSTKKILGIISKILKCKNPQEINRIPGMDTQRSDIILAGAIILETFIKALNLKDILVSPYALREGIVFDTYEKMLEVEQYHHLTNLRFETIYDVAHRYNVDMNHSEHVKQIALKLFDSLKKYHNYSDYEREILECASLLHDIGYWISHSQHHKNSYYIITHSDLPGFTNDEAELIGNIARYHRKSLPKKKHSNFASLPSDTQLKVDILAGILRIAEGIDRRQKQYVKDIEVSYNNKIQIKLIPVDPKIDIDIEIWGANRRKELLEESLNKSIEII
ncbi:MAG TPA: Ppx/GppA phosphatase family protein [Candidatus Kapabacteria bacterium]|jgi:exopolyphosphatase/guanosine-5'-triphosphate,3'-diphosphate pyrophosphatase|nr:Ppx/GppA family phosphatase [Candidatus Kapabacteria bacterium]HOV92958.1 Ppx/GppA phosphatase family protein [Candidatus Kapabacteria bacterium]